MSSQNLQNLQMEKDGPNYSGFYQDVIIYEMAKVIGAGDKYRVEYITHSTIPWSSGDEGIFIPLEPTAADTIRELFRTGKEPYIMANWNEFSKEALAVHVVANPVSDLHTYKRRVSSYIKAFINPIMASAHASIIYGFTTLNNKFILNGLVFSEKTKSLKIIEVMERSEELEDTNPELSQELMDDLEQYIEYKEILDRTNFVWNESEKYIKKIEQVNIDQSIDNGEIVAKEKIDSVFLEFQNKIRTLNNLK